LPTQDTKWTVSFTPPKKGDILLVGSWPNGTCVKRKDAEAPDTAFSVDIGMMMDIVSQLPYFKIPDYVFGPGLVSREGLSERTLFSKTGILPCSDRCSCHVFEGRSERRGSI
jgi:hypothetical protein